MQQNSAMLEYDFEMFEPHMGVSNAAAAPKRKTTAAPAKKPVLKVVEKQQVHKQPRQHLHIGLHSVFVVCFAAVLLTMLGLQISVGARSYELSREIDTVEQDIAEEKTENIRLNNALNSFTSIAKIDDYAVNVLGMTKCESYQTNYIDLTEGDKILYSGNSHSIFDIFNKAE